MKFQFGLKSSDEKFRLFFFEIHLEFVDYIASFFVSPKKEVEFLDSPLQPQEMGFPHGEL
tara:strand:- start:485 stop:664 length:180 start_codon:yes stop_codon:yes gene_type:complete